MIDVLKAAPKITHLDLTNVMWTGFGLRAFAEGYLADFNPKSLASLDLTSNKFSDLDEVYHFGQAMAMCASLRILILRRMRITGAVFEALAKGFSAQLTHINLDFNTLEKAGITAFAKQLQYGQGGEWVSPSKPENSSKGRLLHASLDWKLAYVSVRDNDISDFAYDEICQVVNKLQCLKRLYIAGNLFFRQSRLQDIV